MLALILRRKDLHDNPSCFGAFFFKCIGSIDPGVRVIGGFTGVKNKKIHKG